MFQKRAEETPGRGPADRTTWLMRGGAALLVVLLATFGFIYWNDQHAPSTPSINARQISQAEAAVRKTPNSVDARIALASAYELEKRYDDALAQIDQILKLDPKNRVALLGQGYAYYLKGDLPKAVTSYEAVIDNSPKGEFSTVDTILQEARYYLGTVQVKQKKFTEGKAALLDALKMNATDADALYQLAVAEIGLGENREAVDHLIKALAFVPSGWQEPWTELAGAYTKLGDAPRAAYAKAMGSAAAGEPDQAKTQLQTLVDSPVKVDALIGLGTIAQSQNHKDEAIGWFEKALTADPTNTGARQALDAIKGTTPQSTPSPSASAEEG